MFCSKCGTIIEDGEKFCKSCGNSLTEKIIKDEVSLGFFFLCILIPLIGIINFFMYRKEFPKRSKTYLSWSIGAMIGYYIFMSLQN